MDDAISEQIQHGFHVGLERAQGQVYLYLKAVGKLTHQDYQQLTPFVNQALQGVWGPKVKALLDCTEFRGWDMQAAWDDFVLGLQHGSEFEKIAIVGHAHWLQTAAKVGRWFTGGDVQYFSTFEAAKEWLLAG